MVVELEPPWDRPQAFRVSRAGSSSAVSSSRSCIVTVDMVSPSRMICPGPGSPGCTCSRIPAAWGLRDCPVSVWRRTTNVVYAMYQTKCTVTTVQHVAGISQCRGNYDLRPPGRDGAKLVTMTADAAGNRQDPPAERAPETALNPL